MDADPQLVKPVRIGTHEFTAETYIRFGDPDKPFHDNNCECERCERWRVAAGRPRLDQLRAEVRRARGLSSLPPG